MTPVTMPHPTAETVSPSDALREGAGTITVEDVDGDGQVRVTTEAIEKQASAAEVQLPLFEQRRIPAAVIALGGSIELPLHAQDDVDLIESLRWGRKVTVCVTIGEGLAARDVYLDAEVSARSFAFKGADGIPTTTARITVNERRFDLD